MLEVQSSRCCGLNLCCQLQAAATGVVQTDIEAPQSSTCRSEVADLLTPRCTARCQRAISGPPYRCRYVRCFAASLACMPQQRRVRLTGISIGGLNWLGRGGTAIKVRCRPSGSCEAAKVARIDLDDKRRGACEDCSLEGDIKFEVCCSYCTPCFALRSISWTAMGIASVIWDSPH